MDSNLMSCPTCGHTVNSSAGNCAYCGAVISDRGGKVKTGEKMAGEETPAAQPEPSGQPAAMPHQADEMSEDFDNAGTAAAKPPESIITPKTSAESVAAESAEPAADAGPSAESPAAAEEIEREDDATEKEQAATAEPAADAGPSGDSKSSPEIASTGTEEPAVVSHAEHISAGTLMQEDQTPAEEKKRSGGDTHQAVEKQSKDEPEPEELAVSPATEVLDRTVEEAEESENLEAEILEMIESRISEDEEKRSKASDERTYGDIDAVATQSHHAADRQSNAARESAPEKAGSLISEDLGETILLESADEVQIPAGETSGKATQKMKMETAKPKTTAKARSGVKAEPPDMSPDILKIENAARKMSAEIKKQKERLAEVEKPKDEKAEKAKAQVLKRQKAALAKAQAQKKQQLLLAQAAALKRKKEAEAKARTINNKRVAPAGGEAPKIESASAGSGQKGAVSTAMARNLEADSKLQDLLKKYVGQTIGINYDNSAEIREALLEKANREYFSVFVKDKKLHYNYPLKTILTVIEGQDGVDTGNSKQPHKFNAVIKVYPLVLF